MSPTTDRQQYREGLATLAAKAKETLGEAMHTRIDGAVVLVLRGDVALQEDGTALVGSRTDPLKFYTVNGACTCQDFHRAPAEGWCSHRISRALALRLARELPPAAVPVPAAPAAAAAVAPAALPEAPAALPEAPVSITLKAHLHGHEIMVTLRGVDFASVKAQVEQASQWLGSQAPATDPTTPQCPKHGVMKPSTKGKGFYCPHKLPNGSWCKGR